MLLAEAEAKTVPGPSLLTMMPLFLGIMVLYLLIMKPQQKSANDVRAMREGLKKNDRVLTLGGIYGVVTNIQRETNEVTIKVDEATNTKLRMTLDSIAKVLNAESAGESPAGDAKGA
jgi:preprotein translocase subunit YajC